MPAQDNNNELRGRLFINKDKDAEHPKRPDWNGSCVIAGVVYWISGWNNTAKGSGEKYQALIFKPKEEKPPEPVRDEAPLKEPEEQREFVDTDSLPF